MMSGTGSWLQFANRMNKFKGSYFQDFADISGDLIVRNTGNVYLHAGSNMYITAGDISMNGFIYCKGVVDLSGNSLAGGGDGGGGGLTSLSTVGVKSINTVDFMTTSGYATVGNYLNVTGSTTLNGLLTANGSSTFTGQLNGNVASFNSLSVGNVELKGSIVPDTDSVYDIGSATHKIRDLYVSESSIWIGDNNKLSIDNNKIVIKRRKRGDTDIPKFISDKIGFANITQKVTHVKTFASQNALGKTEADTLSTYSVADWIRFANKKGSLGQNGFVKTNHTASDIYDLTADFNNDDTGQWTTESDGIIKYPGKIMVGNDANTMALETLGRTTLLGKVSIGGYSNSNYDLYVNGGTTVGATLKVDGTSYLANTNVSKSLTVTENTNITGKLGVGKQADATHHLDVLGKSRVSDDAYFKKSLLIGPDVKTTTLTDNNSSGTTLYIETPLESGLYPDVSHNVVINVPNTVFRAQDRATVTNTNSLVIDAANRSILPLVTDINGYLVNTGMTNGWSLGGPGPNRFDNIHARDINISTETINIEDSSGNKIGMSFDATTGSVNYTVVTKDTADASGETFVIKGVQTQKFSSNGGKIDPALLEFTGLIFGETFDSTLTYDFASVYTYDLKTTTYTGDGISSFTNIAGAQGLSGFLSANNVATLLGYIPTKESVVIRVGVDNRSDGGLDGIDSIGAKVDLTNKIISTSDDDGGSMLKWTIWGSEDDLNASSTGNYLNYIELKNINMVSGTYFIAKTPGTLVYNILNQNILKNEDLVDVVNGDLFLYIDRTPGNNWTKIPVSLPSTASITTQMLANNVITPDKIAHGAVTSSKILNGAITNDKIADDSITSVKFKTGEINGSIFEDGSVDGAKISGNINVSKLVGNISGSVISDFTISTSKLLDQSVTGNKIVYMGVSGDRLKDSAITTDKIATDAVTTIKIKDGVITSTKLAVGVINNSNLLADSIITENKILSGAVTESKLASNSISTSKIQDGSIRTAKLAPNSVTLDKINSSVLAGKQNTLVAGAGIAINVNSSGVPVITSTVTNDIQDYSITASKLSGDITSSFQPKLTVGTGINISNSNVITSYSTIPNNSVSSAMIQDGAITPDKLAFGITDTSSTNNTAEDGTFTGNYTEANVDSYSFENKSSYNSKISSDGLTIVSCNQYDTTPRSNTGRIIIKKRDNNLQSWSNATNTFVNCETINGFDMDSSGNTLVFLSKYGASAVINSVNVYDLSSNTMKYSEAGIRDNKNVKLSSDGTKMAIINTSPINMGIDIYEVKAKAPTKPIIKTIIGNSIYHTTDNLSASTITTTITQLYKINKLVINDNTWVAVGDGSANTLVVSNDNGNTWIGKGRVFSHYGTSVFYAQGIWVAVGNDFDKTKLIARSTDDGITWVKSVTLSQGTKLYNMQANDVLYGLGAWWICGTGFELWKSLDSINWTQPIEHMAYVYNVVSLSLVKDVIYSTGMSTDYRFQVIMLYLNGDVTTSTQPTIPFFGRDYGMGAFTHNSSIEKMIYAFGYYIAVGFGGGEGNYSGDDLSYGGNYAQIVYSTAYNAVPKTLKIFTGTCYDIHYDGNQLIATGEDIDPLKRIQYSTDFFNWHPIGLQQPPIERTTSIVNLNIAGKYAYSNDNGINWSIGTAGSVFNKFTKTFYSKRENLWLALGEGMFHTLASSYDGVNWTGKGKIFSVRGISIHYGNDTSGNGVWVAIGIDKDPKKNIAWSTDNGDTWNNPSEIIITKPKDVLYALDRWWIAGNTNGLIWSDNGKDWVIGNKITNFGGNINSISYSEDLHSILMVGDNPNPLYRTMVLFDQSYTTSTISANEIRFGPGGKRGANTEIFGLKTDTTTTIDNNDLIMNKLCYKNGLYIVIGFGGTKETPTASQIGGCNIAINTDMVLTGWRQIRIFTGVGLDLFHDGNKWIATGEDIDPTKRIQYSSNGFDWTPLNYTIPSDIVFTPPTFPLSITDPNQVVYVKNSGKYIKEYDETQFIDWDGSGRYIKILQTRYDYIYFNELEVYDINGTNVALGKTVTSNLGGWPGYINSNLVDGNINTAAHTNTSSAGTGYGYLLVDLGADYQISDIRLTNIHAPQRSNGIRVQILNASQNVLFDIPMLILTQESWSILDVYPNKFTYKRYKQSDSNETILVTTTPFPILQPDIQVSSLHVRYVRILQTIYEHININRLDVYDSSGTNVALGKTVTSNLSRWGSEFFSNMVDGNVNTWAVTTISSANTGYGYFLVDLGADYLISEIKFRNVQDKSRSNGLIFQLLDEYETVLYSTPAITGSIQDEYTFIIPSSTWSSWDHYLDVIRQTYTEPTLTTSLPSTKVNPPGRYIKILQDSSNTIINLLELEAYDKNGTNVALGKTVSAYPGWNTEQDGSLLVNGITSPDNIAQTITGSGNHWMMVDLGFVYEIAEIKIWNRNDTVDNKNLAIGLKIQIIDEVGTVVDDAVVITAEDIYTFTFEPLYVEYINNRTNEILTNSVDVYASMKPPIRYVKLLQDSSNTIINLLELEAYDISGTNLALGKTVTAFPGWNTGQDGSLLVNGITSSENVAQTITGSGNHWIMVDLGAVYEISRIKLWNRNDTIENKNQAIGWKIQLIDEVGTIVKDTPVVITAEDTYNFEFGPLYMGYITTSIKSNVTNIFVRQNKVLYSTDYGNNWTISANKIFDNVTNKISYGNNRWVAVGEDSNNTLSISDDGINWRGLGKIFSNYGKSVLYKNGLWVAVGSDIDGIKSVQFSTDNGLSWSNSNIKIFDYGRDVSYWEDKWVVCGSTDKVHFSVDGISWGDTSNTTSTTVGNLIQLTGVKCLSEQLNNNEYQTSIWSLQDTANDRTYLHKHYEHSTLGVASISSQRVLFDRTISTETKTMVDIPFESNTYNDFATVKNITIIVGWGGTNGYELSGIYGGADICIVKRSLHSTTIDHTYRRIFTGAGLTITNDGSKWIATGEHTDPLKRIQYSTDDGVTWSPYVLPNLDVSDNIITHINHPVSNRTMYSINNTNWNNTSNIDSILDKTNKIYYGNNKWFAVGDGSYNTIASSTDGIFWTGGGKLFSSNGNSIYYKHGIWIAVGKDIDTKKNIAWSLDNGVTWTNPNKHMMDEINDIIFAFDYWWICGSDATKIYKSLTGTDWTSGIDIQNFSLFLKSFFTTASRLFIVAQVGSNHAQFQIFVINHNGGIGNYQVFGNMISPNYNLLSWVGNTVNKGYYANGITIFAGYGGTTVTPTESQVGGCNIAITHNYSTWTYKRIFEGQAYDITYDGSKWIATGEHSDPTRRIQYSTDDGETWSPMFETLDVSNNVTTIISSPLTGEYLYSNDNGSTWTTSINNVFSFGTNKICSNDYNTAWVAVGDGSMNTVAISSDGINWTGKGLIFNIRGNSVYHNNGVWVAVGQDTDANRNIAWSTDNGDTWSYPNFYMFYEGMDVVFALNRWIVCGFGNFIFWSLDGITWNDANKLYIHASQWLINKLQVSNDRVIVSGRNNNHTAFFKQLYLDPVLKVQTLSFNMIPLSSGDTQHGFAELNDIVYHEGSYYVVGDVGNNTNSDENDLIIYNGQVNNNIHWATSSFTSSMNNFTNGVGKSINTDGSKLIITGESSEISKRVQYSEDNGINWNSYLPLSEQASNYVTNIITLSNTGKYAYSTDEGLNWTVNDDNVFSVSMNKIHYSKTQQIWMAVGEGSTNTVALSTDGINWTGKGMIFNIKGNSVYYTGGLWVAVGKDTDTTKNIAWSSDNGDTWNYPSETLLTIHGNDVLYAFNRWFVCGNNTSVYWSYNGITWNTANKHTAPNISANSDVLNMLWDQHKIHLSMIDYTQTGTNFVLWNSSQIQTVLSTSASSQTISAIGGNKTVFSNDGNGNVHVSKITYGNGIYMASGSGNGNIAYTNRYTTGAWNRQDIFTGAGNDIIYDGSKWIATGEHSTLPNRIQFSNDKGITWYPSGISELDTIGDANTIIKYYSTFSPEEKVPKVSYIYKKRDAINILYQEINYDSCVYNQSISDQTMVYTDIDTTTAAKTLIVHSKSNVAATIISVGTGAHTISYCAGDSLKFIGLGNSIFSIAGHKTHYNGDTWVAVGEGVNTIAVSEDGINWTGKGMIFGIRGKSVHYAKGMWIAVGEDNTSSRCIAYSTNNGATWSYSNSSIFSTSANDIVYTDHNGWIAVGQGTVNTLATSDNGIVWTVQGLVMDISIDSIAHGGLYHIMLGGRDSNYDRCYLYNNQHRNRNQPLLTRACPPLSEWPFNWTSIGNPHNWTRVYSVYFRDNIFGITSDGTTRQASIGAAPNTVNQTNDGGFVETWKTKGFLMLPDQTRWVYGNVSTKLNVGNIGRYIKILQTRYEHVNINELEVFDTSGTNVALGKTVTSNIAPLGSLIHSNLVDGNKVTVAHTVSSNTTTGYGYYLVDLGADYTISEIRLTNTHHMPRSIGLKIQILDSDQTVVEETVPIS